MPHFGGRPEDFLWDRTDPTNVIENTAYDVVDAETLAVLDDDELLHPDGTPVTDLLPLLTDAYGRFAFQTVTTTVHTVYVRITDSIGTTDWGVIASQEAMASAGALASGDYVPSSAFTAKGVVLGATGAGAPIGVAAGTNGQVLTADSTALAGVTWAAAAGSGGSTNVVGDLLASITAGTTAIMSHRGHRHVFPENSIAGYVSSASVADAMEVSFWRTADGVPIIMHDNALDRTTNATGDITDKLWSEILDIASIDIGATVCGAGWDSQPIPTLSWALSELAGVLPLLVEPKGGTTADSDALFKLLAKLPSPTEKIIFKAYRSSTGGASAVAAAAHALGYTTWVHYLEADSDTMLGVGASDPNVDIMALHANSATTARITIAGSTGKIVCVHNVFRRSEVAAYEADDVHMIMSPQPAYLKGGAAPILAASQWGTRLRAPGEIKYAADSDTFPVMTAADECITLPTGTASTLLCGQLCGTAAPTSYELVVSMRWPTLPTATLHSDIAFGHATDSPYLHQGTANDDGYHLVVRPVEGYVQLYTHVNGSGTGTKISELGVADQVPIIAGAWATFKITVTATQVTLERTDISTTPVTVTSNHARGSYIHLAAGSSNVSADFRRVSVTSI
jgi:glycerophosphoryl diester phosphodiesterase